MMTSSKGTRGQNRAQHAAGVQGSWPRLRSRGRGEPVTARTEQGRARRPAAGARFERGSAASVVRRAGQARPAPRPLPKGRVRVRDGCPKAATPFPVSTTASPEATAPAPMVASDACDAASWSRRPAQWPRRPPPWPPASILGYGEGVTRRSVTLGRMNSRDSHRVASLKGHKGSPTQFLA